MKCNFFLTSLCSSMYICKFGQKIHTYHFPLLFWMYIRFHSYCFNLLPTMINDYIHTSIFFLHFLHTIFLLRGNVFTRAVSIFLVFLFWTENNKNIYKKLFSPFYASIIQTKEFPRKSGLRFTFFLILKSTILFTPYLRSNPQKVNGKNE